MILPQDYRALEQSLSLLSFTHNELRQAGNVLADMDTTTVHAAPFSLPQHCCAKQSSLRARFFLVMAVIQSAI